MTRRLAAVPDPDRRLVAYVRVSALMGRGGERFHSPDVQLDAIRALARQRGLVEVEVVQDIDRTGRNFAREGIQQILTMAQEGRVDVVGLYDLSRLGRNTAESLRFIATLRDLGVAVVSTTEQIDDSPEGQFMLGQFLGMAQLYSDQVGRRWASIHERRHEAGQFHGKVPLGYLIEDGKAVPDPLLGPVITWAFTAYLDGSASQKDIAARLTAARGALVRQGVVSNLLRNPFHAGHVMYRRERRPGQHLPLVSQDVFDAVQRKLARDLLAAPRTRVPMSFLGGLVVCDTCGVRLYRRGNGNTAYGYSPRWRCDTQGCAGVGSPHVGEVEAAVLTRLLEVAAQITDGLPRVTKAARSIDLAPLQAAVTDAQKRLAALGAALARGTITDDEFGLFAVEVRADIAAAEARLGEAEDAVVTAVPPAALRSAAERVELLWPDMTVQEQRAVTSLLLPVVRLRRAAYRGEPVAKRLRYSEPGSVSS